MIPIRRVVIFLAVLAGLSGVASGASVSWMRSRANPIPGPIPTAAEGARIPAPPGVLANPIVLSVTDAVEVREGSWIVLDGRSSRWHVVSSEGTLERSVGGPGDGPGELRNPIGLALVGDTVVVGARTGGTVERFLIDGRPLDRLRVSVPGCEAGLLRRLAVAGTTLHLLRECLDPRSGESTLQVHRLGAEGTLTLIASRPWMDLGGGEAVRLGRPILAGGGDLLLFGDATEDCLEVLLPVHRAGERVCHPAPPRIPLSPQERIRAEELKARVSAQGLALDIPDFAPPFDAAFIARGDEVVFRSIRGQEVRSLDPLDGRTLEGPSPDGSWSPMTFVGATTILTAGETMDGTWLLVMPRG